MKKIYIEEYGSVDVMKETDVPAPDLGNDEIQVKLVSASVNDSDIAIRQYGPFPTMPKEMRPVLPHMVGSDYAGIVTDTGKYTGRFKIGDHVIGINMSGVTAEYITVNEKSLIVKVPETIDLVPLGGLYVAGSTAWAAVVNNGKVTAGQRVLIHGAAGGVGSMAVQFAKARGAYVIATAGRYSFEYLKDLGADELIDYKTQNFTTLVKDVDAVINLTGPRTLEQSYQVVKKGGILTSTNGVPDAAKAGAMGIQAVYTIGMVSFEDMDAIVKLYTDGRLKINITKTYPFSLEGVKQAHIDFEKGPNQGKRLIVF